MQRIGIVTDSTCDLSDAVLAELDVVRVPLKVLFGDESFRDWVDLQPAEFYAKLSSSDVLPKTSQPSPADFLEVYRRLADEGCEGIVSIHLSGSLSGTCESAYMAADESPIPVHVTDSRTVSQALGLVVKAAAAARAKGSDLAGVVEVAQKVTESIRILFVLDTLEYLVKGGRAGKAAGLAASLLNIKPVLEVREGVVEPFTKVKGRKRALTEMAAEVAREASEKGHLRCAILHGCLDDEGAELVSEIQAANADVEFDSPGLVGAVIGTYTGLNALGVAFYPAGILAE